MDDGSTDGTREIIDTYKDPRIRYVWQKNQERSAARNHGIGLAKGSWICFQDSDDEYLPEHLQVLYDGIENHPDYKVIRTGLLIYENGIYVGDSGITSGGKYDQFPFECFTTATFHFTLLREIQFNPQYFIIEDLHFLLKIGLDNEIKVLNMWTGIYHCDPRSSGGIGMNYHKNLKNQKECLDDIINWNKTLIIQYVIRKRCLNDILMFAGHLKYRRSLTINAFIGNILIFGKFPIEYIKLVARIMYVLAGEWSGLYHTRGRF